LWGLILNILQQEGKIMDLVAIASTATALLTPYLKKAGEKAAEEVGKKLPEKVGKMWNAIMARLSGKPAAEEAVKDLVANPEDKDNQASFRKELRKLIESDAFFASILAELLKSAQHEAGDTIIVKGFGPVATKGGVAAGGGGIAIKGDVHGDIHVVNAGKDDAIDLSDSRRKTYLQELEREANILPWGCVTAGCADPSRDENLGLADVYTGLDTTELRQVKREEDLRQFLARIHEAERLPVQEVANRTPRLLIMGDPGSGKSTFMKYVCYVLARAGQSEDPSEWLVQLAPWRHGVLLPVWVELRYMAAFARESSEVRADAGLLLKYLHHLLVSWEQERFWPELDGLLRGKSNGAQPLLILCDGLDEVPTEQRQLLVNVVNDFCKRYKSHRYIVTCRPYAYVGQPWQLHGFHEVTLAPFNEEQIDRFVQNWYGRLAGCGRLNQEDATERMKRLQEALRRPDLRSLAERPLLLTLMAQLHTFRGQLPDERTQLYADAVDLLLQRWESRMNADEGLIEKLRIPGLRMNHLEAGLFEVAYRAHAKQSDSDTADIEEGELRQWLARHLAGEWDKAGVFVNYIRERAGLLVRHRTEAYTFPHRSFQEFLAACHLMCREDYPGEAARLVRENFDRWREVFLLAAGHARRSHRLGQALSAVNMLCPEDVDRMTASDAQPWRIAQLAGEALLEIGLLDVNAETAGGVLLKRVQGWLAAAIRKDDLLTARERASGGRILAKLGDPRREVLMVEKMEFCEIPAGLFVMGSKDQSDTGDDERPQDSYVILYDYRMSRYIVTNAQYRQFVKAGGYGISKYWSEAKKEGIWNNGFVQDRYDDTSRESFVDFGEPYNLPNHPVVGITWYEALAFTRWLTEHLRGVGKLAADWEIRLPSEPEWEKAARGTERRIYPWDGDANPERANYAETGIDATSAVGCFPNGVSPYGLEDISGNVWEWTRSVYGSYPYPQDNGGLAGRENLMAALEGDVRLYWNGTD
jgi:formylglycine-generating enzyme required for sulfatase activity